MNEEEGKHVAGIIVAVFITVGMISALALIDSIKKAVPVIDVGDTIVFSKALTDSPAYKQCVKKDLRTIKEFKDCLKDKGAM